MARGKFEKRRSPILPLIMILVTLIALGSTAGGVAAYLSTGTKNDAQTTFTVAQCSVSVDGDTVTITSPDCDVYLRVAVVANEQNGSNIIAGTSRYPGADENWTAVTKAIYEYKSPVKQGSYELSTLGLSVPAGATVAAQVIQAVGTIDNGDQPAKANAWNGSPAIP